MVDTIEKKYVDLAGLGHYDEKIKKVITDADTKVLADATDMFDAAGTAETKVKALADGAVKTNTKAIAKLNGGEEDAGSVAKAVKDAKDAVDAKIGTLDDLTMTNKTDLVVALNEVAASVEAGGTGSVVTVKTDVTTDGAAKSYTLYQGSTKITTIDIPKDMVVSSGVVETNPVGQDAGTYLVLTLANATNDKVYINVGKLVDIYKAAKSATQIQIAIDSATREISAAIVAGSIGATELASNAVITTKIADGNVTKAKLSADVQTSLGKADSAIQEDDLTNLRADVAANKASLAEGGATDTAIKTAKKAGDDAATAVADLADGQVRTNKNDIATLKNDVETIKATTYTAISNDEIDSLFATV